MLFIIVANIFGYRHTCAMLKCSQLFSNQFNTKSRKHQNFVDRCFMGKPFSVFSPKTFPLNIKVNVASNQMLG